MYTNANITIYNKYLDEATRLDKHKRTTIKNVFFDEKKAVNRLQSGLESADHVLLLIPFDYTSQSNYVSPREFEELEDKSNHFTLKTGDKIIKGDIEYEVERKISELDELYETFTITSVDSKDFGSSHMRHWELGAK